MEIVDSGICGLCGKNDAAVKCDGCGKILCIECRKFDIWCFGCGHGATKAYCPQCFKDPEINYWHLPEEK